MYVTGYSRYLAVLLLVAVVFCCCSSCSGNSDNNRIKELYFVSFTDFNNSLYMNEEDLGPKWKPLLKQKETVELAHEVEAIPDSSSTEGSYSYIIRICYVESGVEKKVEKVGYNTFPDNWDRVVELTNKVSGEYDHVTNSRNPAVVDAEYLRAHCFLLDESIIPEDMSLDEIIREVPITYLTLFEPTVYSDRTQDLIVDYLYDHFDLKSHQIDKLDEKPAASSKEEMKEFAYSRLEDVKWEYADECICAGTYKGEEYRILRCDMVQTWLAKEAKYYDTCGFNGTHCQYQTSYEWEVGGYANDYWDVFVDGSGRFLILTKCNKPGDIAAVVK